MIYIIKKESSFIYKKNKSKFVSYSFKINNESNIKQKIIELKKRHQKANHFCYAYKTKKKSYFSDDGEPKNSAGKPMLNQIYSKDIINVLIVVVRYFGGKKLGIQELVKAYKNCATETLKESGKIIYKELNNYIVTCDFENINILEAFIKKENIKTNNKIISNTCEYSVTTTDSNFKKIKQMRHCLIIKKNN